MSDGFIELTFACAGGDRYLALLASRIIGVEGPGDGPNAFCPAGCSVVITEIGHQQYSYAVREAPNLILKKIIEVRSDSRI